MNATSSPNVNSTVVVEVKSAAVKTGFCISVTTWSSNATKALLATEVSVTVIAISIVAVSSVVIAAQSKVKVIVSVVVHTATVTPLAQAVARTKSV